MRKILAISFLVLLAACSPTVVKERPVQVKVPVAQPCALQRPERPVELVQQTPHWNAMDVRQKSAALGKWALELLSYSEQLDAATAACR